MPEPNDYSLLTFLRTGVPQIIDAAVNLKAVLINPGPDEENPSGEIPTGEDSLKIFLVVEMIPALILKKVAATGWPEESERLFIALYLPDRQFEEFRTLVLRLRGSYPAATIAALTCNHAAAVKEDGLVPLLKNKIINFLVLDNDICGGKTVMTQIAEQFIRFWP